MTIRAEIIGDEPPRPEGWVQVDPFDYDYTGPDPTGEIEAYLNGISAGEVEFSWPVEDDVHEGEYPPDLKIIEIRQTLHGFDEIWVVSLPEDFEITTLKNE